MHFTQFWQSFVNPFGKHFRSPHSVSRADAYSAISIKVYPRLLILMNERVYDGTRSRSLNNQRNDAVLVSAALNFGVIAEPEMAGSIGRGGQAVIITRHPV